MLRCVVSLTIVALGLTFARADDFVQFGQREQLLAQKWSRDVASALDVSRRLERTDSAAAREALQGALNALKAAPGLNETLRADLNRQLNARLANMPTNAPQPKSITPPRPTGFAAGGFTAPSAGPTPTPPAGGAAGTARSFIDKQNNTLSKANDSRDDRAAGYSGVISGITNSAVPTDRDMAFNANHAAIAARRAPVVSAKEETLMKALGSTVDANFAGMTFRQALSSLSEKTGLLIIPEANSLKEANVEYDDPVNFSVNGKVTVRTILRKILGDRGLAYVVNEGTVNVVTAQRARESTVVRIYPINDLVTPIQPQPQYVVGPYGNLIPVAPGTFPPGTPGVTPSFKQQMGQTVAEMVRTSVDPTYWAPLGPGTVTFNEATGSLIVRANAEVHFMVNGAMSRR